MKIELPNVTLIAIDCVDYSRVKAAVEYSSKDINFASKKILTHFDVNDSIACKIEPIQSIKSYSEFVIKKLTNYFETDYVLIVQWDGIVLNSNLWTDEFLHFDYIGAPWTPNTLKEGIPKKFNVGNGGFSLRSKKLHEHLASDENIIMHEAEDVAICQLNRNYLELLGFNFAPYEIAAKFSWETGPERVAFGSHARHKVEIQS